MNAVLRGPGHGAKAGGCRRNHSWACRRAETDGRRCVCAGHTGLQTLPPLGVETPLGLGALQLQDHHLMELQEEGVQARLVQESAEELGVFRAEISFVP